MVKEQIVHLPEAALGRRRFGRLGGELGLGMDRAEGHVAKDVAQPIAEPLL